MELRLDGRHAIVCGSTSGIGKAIAIEFARSGADITLIARNEKKLQMTLGELETNKNQNHEYLIVNFDNPDELETKLANYFIKNRKVDILVNNTGGPPAGPLITATRSEFVSAFQSHLICNHILVTSVLDEMKENNFGRIINIISTSVRQPIDNLGVSNTTRGAVGNWAKTLANEIGQFGITVNNILPGPIRTPRLESIIKGRASKLGISEDEVEENWKKSIPLKRIGEPIEIANVALFLASDASSYITGTNIIVDGGRTKTY